MTKIHIMKFIDNFTAGGWPTHFSLGARCGRRRPDQFTSKRSRATCKACLKEKPA